ncbi:MAG: hypothetical protein JSW00_18740 [Thermoplasmata archaeon]|nr:MAG: hypothetical protein JSW00_18740 [Thermoplasmata archaeon]
MQNEIFIIMIITLLVGISFILDKNKTLQGLKNGAKHLHKILPEFLLLLIFVSVFLSLVSQSTLVGLLGRESGPFGIMIAAGIGSIALIPGAIAYPLAGELMRQGASYTILATFITTLMMVGILTFPVERKYLGNRLAILRNVMSFIGALLISVLVGVLL